MESLYNLILVLDTSEQHVLMCYRQKAPYKGLYNLLGGKIEPNENHLDSAYRELFEESGITKDDVTLYEFMDFVWYPLGEKMHVYIGKLLHTVVLQEEIHPLFWIPITTNFFDLDTFAGEGNIGHMIEIYKQKRGVYFKDE